MATYFSIPEDTNHVGKVYRLYDGAGVATSVAFDFKGNAFEEQRQLVASKLTQPDWTDLVGEENARIDLIDEILASGAL